MQPPRKLGDDAVNPTYFFIEPRFGYMIRNGREQGPRNYEALPLG